MKFSFNIDVFANVGARIADQIVKVKRALMLAVNSIGRTAVKEYSHKMADDTGGSPDDIAGKLDITEATEEKPFFEMDASKIVPEATQWSRPWEARGEKEFENKDLIQIVTQHDDAVCPLCQRAERNGPYTPGEIAKIQAANPHGDGIVHPRCRCILQSWSSFRRTPVRFAASQSRSGGGFDPKDLFSNANLIGKKVADSFRVIFKK